MAQLDSDSKRSPYKAVEEAAERLNRSDRAFGADAEHNSRCVMNAAGSGEALETDHRVVAHVPRDREEDFEQAASEIAETFGVEIVKRDDRGRGGRKRFILRP